MQWHRWAPLRKHRILVSLVSPRTRVLVICSKAKCTNHSREVLSGPPLTYYLFSRLLKRGPQLWFYFPMPCMPCFTSCYLRVLYFLLPSGVYILYCTFAGRIAKRVVHTRLAADANPESASEYGRTSIRVA